MRNNAAGEALFRGNGYCLTSQHDCYGGCCRPDLVDYRQARQQSARQNLEMAFNIFEREFAITRLLDPEGT